MSRGFILLKSLFVVRYCIYLLIKDFWSLKLRGTVSVLEIVFIGQREVFVCLYFVLTFFFSLGREAHRSANGASVL